MRLYLRRIDALSLESVVSIEGEVQKRTDDTINENLPTGQVEIRIGAIELLSKADPLPMPVNQESDYPEEIRFKYRYLDLRRAQMQKNIQMRNQVIATLQNKNASARLSRVSNTDFNSVIS